MSRHKPYPHKTAMVIAVDGSYLPMMEVSRRKALKALATGRALALDLRTWSKLALHEVAGMPLAVIVFAKARQVPEVKLGSGRGNRAILRRDDYRCQFKGCDRKATTVDHLVPRAQGGRSTWLNLVASCRPCNQRKGARTPAEAGMELKAPVRSPRFHLLARFQELVRTA